MVSTRPERTRAQRVRRRLMWAVALGGTALLTSGCTVNEALRMGESGSFLALEPELAIGLTNGMAEAVLRQRLQSAGLDAVVAVESAGTTSSHRGEPPDPRAVARAEARGYDLQGQRARSLQAQGAVLAAQLCGGQCLFDQRLHLASEFASRDRRRIARKGRANRHRRDARHQDVEPDRIAAKSRWVSAGRE